MSLVHQLAQRDFEQVMLCRDPATGLESVIAVHDTTLGPALGGVRMRRYPSPEAAIADALDLAQAMTYKAALAGLELGGGKSVINADPTVANKAALLAAHARYIATLEGRYIPGVDMGTTIEDLKLIGQWAPVVCSQRGDPSLFTARGVVRSIEAALPYADLDGLSGRGVAVQGLGSVGHHVVRMLVELGARVLVADVDETRVARVCAELGATPVAVADVLSTDVDVLCPCAAGAVITADVVAALRARVLAGAANNVLADRGLASVLAARGIVHVPDVIANAGGLMAVEAELRDDETELEARVDAIATTTDAVLARSAATGADTVSVALALAQERLDARRASRPYFARSLPTPA